MVGTFKVIIGSIAALGTTLLATPATATPITLTESYSSNGNSISGSLQGDYSGNVLSLSPVPYSSILTIDLKAPPLPIADPVFVSTAPWCSGYTCTIKGYLNANYTFDLTPWNFDIGGTVEFNDNLPLGGIANLTATPIPVAQIGYISGTATPSFTVMADQNYGPINQFNADLAATVLQGWLNGGNWKVNVDGTGIWDSVDLGTFVVSSAENAGLTTLVVTLGDTTLNGAFSYNADLTFDHSILNVLESSYISLFGNAIYGAMTGELIKKFNELAIPTTINEDYTATTGCSASETGSRSANVTCVATAAFTGSFPTPGYTSVPEPATFGLFGLGLVGVIWSRRRRHGA